MKYTDEQLSAYIDGELDAKLARLLKKDLARNKKLNERLANLKTANKAAQDLLSPIIDEDIPKHITDMLKPANNNTKNKDNVISLSGKTKNIFNSKWSVPIAAMLAMTFGILFGREIGVKEQENETIMAYLGGEITPKNPLFNILEKSVSARPVALNEGFVIEPVLSFKSAEGYYCREFYAHNQVSAKRGLACKQNNGWNIIALNKTDEIIDKNSYRTASGRGNEYIDFIIDDILDGDVFDLEEEKKLIKNNWYIDNK